MEETAGRAVHDHPPHMIDMRVREEHRAARDSAGRTASNVEAEIETWELNTGLQTRHADGLDVMSGNLESNGDLGHWTSSLPSLSPQGVCCSS